jgi:tellurium resistance protein TerZ
LVDQVWFNQLRSKDGAVVHTGDNRTGAGDGDDESIVVQLGNLPGTVSTLVFTVNSFTGQDFTQIENAYCRLVDETNGKELARFDLTGSGQHTAQVMAKVTRDGSGWSMTAIGAITSGRTIQDLLPAVAAHL